MHLRYETSTTESCTRGSPRRPAPPPPRPREARRGRVGGGKGMCHPPAGQTNGGQRERGGDVIIFFCIFLSVHFSGGKHSYLKYHFHVSFSLVFLNQRQGKVSLATLLIGSYITMKYTNPMLVYYTFSFLIMPKCHTPVHNNRHDYQCNEYQCITNKPVPRI